MELYQIVPRSSRTTQSILRHVRGPLDLSVYGAPTLVMDAGGSPSVAVLISYQSVALRVAQEPHSGPRVHM